jgi:hypothetical protein
VQGRPRRYPPVPVRRCFLLIPLVAAAVAFPPLSGATDVPTVGTTSTVVCVFDSQSQAGVTVCSQVKIRITGGVCYPAGVLAPNPTRLFFHDEFSSSREYQGNAILPGSNGIPSSGAFGDVPLGGDLAAWYDAIYAQVVRPHARLISSSGVSESRLNSYAFYVDDPSCA